MGKFGIQQRMSYRLSPVSAHSTCFWRRWTRWETGPLRSEAGVGRSPPRPHPWDPSPGVCLFLGHMQGVPGALGLGITNTVCVRWACPALSLPVRLPQMMILIKA